MDLQNTYLQVFLSLLAIVLGFIGYLQFRLTKQQIERLKEKTKQETIEEIERDLGVSSMVELKSSIQKQIEDVEKKHYSFGYHQLHFELTKMANEKETSWWHLVYLMDVYESSILKSFHDFNYFVSEVDSLIFNAHREGRIDINSQHIDKVIKKMKKFEDKFRQKSENLEHFQKQISYHRNQEKQKTSSKK